MSTLKSHFIWCLAFLVILQLTLVHSQILSKSKRESKKKDCQYEKADWTPCDPKTGQQKRTLRLIERPNGDPNPNPNPNSKCKASKEVTRSCKPSCRYVKGAWTECIDGVKNRVDTLRDEGTYGCESTRAVQKPCKPTCKYSKGDWSSCDDKGIKQRILTRIEGDGPACEPTRVITKTCLNQGRKNKNKSKNRNKSGNHGPVSSPNPVEMF